MKMVKSLILGSAAGLLALGGAQAADLPVKAKAVEYVRICSLYGAGFYYIPGTDTCIKLGGYLRVDVLFNTNSDDTGNYSGTAGANNRLRNYYTWRSREDLNIDTRTNTEYGVVRTFWDATFSWTTANPPTQLPGSFVPAQAAGIAGSDTIGVYHAFIQFAGWTLGKTISAFSAPWTNYPANNFDGLVGGGGDVTGVNQITYTAQFGNGISGTISIQDQVAYYTTNLFNLSNVTLAGLQAGGVGTNNFGGASVPDVVGKLAIDQAWGEWEISAAAHDNHAGFYASPTLALPANGAISGTELAGHPGDKWGWAVQTALSLKTGWIGAGDTLNVSAVYTDGASRYNFQDLTGTSYSILNSGPIFPGSYGSIGLGSVTDAVFVTGSSLQTTKTWGMRGGYNHNWNPYWNTGLYGAYAAVSYDDEAKLFICNNFRTLATVGNGFSCNPDFNVGQIGVITRWTPVKNLTFSGDFTYTHLDQKFTGSAALPLNLLTGKPAAVYDFKDQNTLLFLFRAQRNW